MLAVSEGIIKYFVYTLYIHVHDPSFLLTVSYLPPRVQNAPVHHQYLIPIPPLLFGLRMELGSSVLGKHLYPQNHHSGLAKFFLTSSQAFNYNPPMIIFVVILDFGFYWLALLWLFASNRMCFWRRRSSCLSRYPKWFISRWGGWRNSVVWRARLAPNWDGLKSMDSSSSLAFAEGSWGASLWCMLRCFEDPHNKQYKHEQGLLLQVTFYFYTVLSHIKELKL